MSPVPTNTATADVRLRGLPLLGGGWLGYLTIVLAVVALFATPLQMLRIATALPESAQLLVATSWAMLSTVLAWRFRDGIHGKLLRLASLTSSIGPAGWIGIGLGLRLAWIALFPSTPGSDGGTYLMLADQLLSSGTYETDGTYAYWPIGYPLFLSAWLWALPSAKWAYLCANLAQFVVAAYGIHRLANLLGGARAGRVATALFAVWPNMVFNTATPEKEMLVLAILPWALFLLLQVLQGQSRWRALASGALLGAATLIQPSLQFLPFVGAILLLIAIPGIKHSLAPAAFIILGAALIVTPWTLRNHLVFDSFVLVSTNGGDNLYRANNPLATGGYVARGEVDLSSLGELERDTKGRQLALAWIRTHPEAFRELAVEKLIRFMGDDAVGVYNTLKVGRASDNGILYAAAKAWANAFWMLVWFCLAASCFAVGHRQLPSPLARAPLWLWLYLLSLHTLFESAGKYHVPMIWVLCVLLAVHVSHERQREAP